MKLQKTVVIVAALLLISVAAFTLQQQVSHAPSNSVTKPVSRQQMVLQLLSEYNDAVTSEEGGYEYLARNVRQDERFNTVEKYLRWLEKIRESFPKLGTEDIQFRYDASGSAIFGFKSGDELEFVLSDQGENLNEYKIVEIISSPLAKGDSLGYTGTGCKLLFQERSPADEDCPDWNIAEQ